MFSWSICLCFVYKLTSNLTQYKNCKPPCACVRCAVFKYILTSFHLVSFQSKGTSNAVGMSFLIFWLQAEELSVGFKTSGNLNGNLNKRRLSSSAAQTITTEWTAEIWVNKRVQRKQTPKHKLGNRANRWSKVQEDARCPSSESSLRCNGNNAKGNIDWKQLNSSTCKSRDN